MNHIVIDIETANEPSSSEFPIIGNYDLDSNFGNFVVGIYKIPKKQWYELNLYEDNFQKIGSSTNFVNYINLSSSNDLNS